MNGQGPPQTPIGYQNRVPRGEDLRFPKSASDILPRITSRLQGNSAPRAGYVPAMRGPKRVLAVLMGTFGSLLGIEAAGGIFFDERWVGLVFWGESAFLGSRIGFLGAVSST